MNIATIALVVLLVGYLLVRRMTGQLMEARRMLVLPTILALVGLASLNSTALSATAIGFLLLGCIVGVGFGVIRGYTVRISERDGTGRPGCGTRSRRSGCGSPPSPSACC
ncbi:hypothetical protein [Rhodococcus sp. 06-235-1A]|uniref:hypothetical protein n=1 Tax=Rhodococcus sp. 06-235-1A TaxID=2022508 RepID=UPI00211B1A6F|nr:hypothetical protein [Rhodococcus sp. 06-235-1A]